MRGNCRSAARQRRFESGGCAAALRAKTPNKASVYWSAACANAFKIVFLRTAFTTNSAFTVVATRGPFTAVAEQNDVMMRAGQSPVTPP